MVRTPKGSVARRDDDHAPGRAEPTGARAGRVRPAPFLPTDYVTPAVVESLIGHGTTFVDSAGNLHLDGTAADVAIIGRSANRTFRLSSLA